MKNQNALCFGRKFRFNALLILCAAIMFAPASSHAQQNELEYDEIIVTLTGPAIGTAEIPAIIVGQDVYLPVTDLFNFLTIKNSLSGSGHDISGFLLNPNDGYSINRIDNQIVYNDSITKLHKNDLIFSSSEFYLNAKYFGQSFGLECAFQFRSLTVQFSTKIELPFMKEKRLEQMRRNLTQLKGEVKPDTIVKRNFEAFHLGALDWNITSTWFKGNQNNLARVGVGAVLAGGEASAQLNFTNRVPFQLKNQFFLWRYANNDKKYFKQISIGQVHAPGAYSAIPSMVGIQINNTPTRQRTAFGSYLVSDVTEPGWIVELYVNNVLVNYTKADASGLFSFEVPLVYGNMNVRFKYYGPWGEEKFSDQIIQIPFSFLPKNKFDYSLTAGRVIDSLQQPFSRLHFIYGLSKRITIGSGVEYNSALVNRSTLPFAQLSARIGKALIFFGEYSPGTLFKTTGNVQFKNKLQMEALYIKYAPGQEAIRTGSLQEKKLMASLPFKTKNAVGFGRLTINHSTFFKGELKTAELLMNASKGRINANITTYAVLSNWPDVMSRLALTIPLPFKIRFTPQVQYNYAQNKFVLIKAEAEKRAFKTMVATMGYEYNRLAGFSGFSVGLRQNFSFAQIALTARNLSGGVNVTQAASGGLGFDDNFRHTKVTDRSNVGQGSILILPFLDYNYNGRRDKGEPDALNLNVRVDGSRIERSYNKASIKVSALESYNKYYILLDDQNFDNPAYRIKHKVIEIIAEPNMIKKLPVPVFVVGEVAGYVSVQSANNMKGIGRIIVHIYDEFKRPVAKILTEEDGYFSYLGLLPGTYTVHTDVAQLRKIEMHNDEFPATFTIKASKEGDIVDNLRILIGHN